MKTEYFGLAQREQKNNQNRIQTAIYMRIRQKALSQKWCKHKSEILPENKLCNIGNDIKIYTEHIIETKRMNHVFETSKNKKSQFLRVFQSEDQNVNRNESIKVEKHSSPYFRLLNKVNMIMIQIRNKVIFCSEAMYKWCSPDWWLTNYKKRLKRLSQKN